MRYLPLPIAALVVLIILTSSAVKSATPNVGPKADVAAVIAAQSKYWNNKLVKDPFRIDGVHVVGDYALFQWYGEESAGFGVYKRVSGEVWKKITYSGGAIAEDDLASSIRSKLIAHRLCSGWPKLYSPCSD